MASRKALVLTFVAGYIGDHGYSPSTGEIGEACGISRERARVLVHKLVRDGKLLLIPGKRRTIALPDSQEAAIQLLRELGWKIDPDAHAVAVAIPLAKNRLTLLPMLDHIPVSGDGSGQNGGIDPS